MLKRVTLIIMILFMAVIVYLAYLGLFYKVKFVEKEVGPFGLVYEKHVGDYNETLKIQKRIYDALFNEDKIETYKGYRIYYDDPKNIERTALRSEVGCILENRNLNNLENIREKYNVRGFPRTKSIIVEFPFKNKISILIAVMKIYPALQGYSNEKGYNPVPALEVYDMTNKKIIYIQPIK
ncbi:MAG: hypothetical protein DKM50_01695 [Candidatus Margulisiibacteriota bacterium]|nr:MAG: hypothetical protein A2X43_13450 [Candidatus Margulisbacteria bacterium GWD2_39_127]OGI04737.1 MAG: hypothetical protein A2X42_10545 [Candidatus Margulisbacteria bacterium GWF2_38_17]OGI05682.1 MAG: hypothetical protein A2X41_03130 [Candidatus Margulisbacteria bacterium GWE2_39_32]PZM83616.1 MAG: hypothetical protein DKM50_01695 [Candidatus Margulisiibacteriota bacterium]HAR62034.1 hypothetical protein [Candidatus Margulisiibacteriota bacterium]